RSRKDDSESQPAGPVQDHLVLETAYDFRIILRLENARQLAQVRSRGTHVASGQVGAGLVIGTCTNIELKFVRSQVAGKQLASLLDKIIVSQKVFVDLVASEGFEDIARVEGYGCNRILMPHHRDLVARAHFY